MTSQYYHTCMLTKYIYINISYIRNHKKTPPDNVILIQTSRHIADSLQLVFQQFMLLYLTFNCCTFYLVIFNLSLTLSQFFLLLHLHVSFSDVNKSWRISANFGMLFFFQQLLISASSHAGSKNHLNTSGFPACSSGPRCYRNSASPKASML